MGKENYLGNSLLKGRDVKIEWTEELLEEFVKCKEDPLYFAERYVHIVDVDKGFVKINLYEYQKEIIEKVYKNRRIVANCSRQSGKTTTAVVIILHYVIFNKHKTVALLSNKGDSARDILSRIQAAYEALPKWLQQGVLEWNKGSIEFENGCKILAGSTSSSSIRGKSCLTDDNRVCVEKDGNFYFTQIYNIINKSELVEVEGDEMYYAVYKTINTANNKVYVGFHKIKSLEDIIENEFGSIFKDGYLGSGKTFKKALEKYGPKVMKQELLFLSDNKNEAEQFEREIVNEEWISSDDNYNLSLGGNVCILYGKNNGFYGKKHSEETINKIQKNIKETAKYRKFSWCEVIDTETDNRFYTYKEIIDAFSLCDKYDVYRLIYEGKLKHKSEYLQEKAVNNWIKRKEWLDSADQRKEEFKKMISERFKGISKSEESNVKRGNSLKEWIEKNPDKHKERMEKINKNPEKIKKMAKKHRGMTRSAEARKKMSEASFNRDKIYIHDENFNVKLIDKNQEIPEGWFRGKGDMMIHNSEGECKKIKKNQEIPEGWFKGLPKRKK